MVTDTNVRAIAYRGHAIPLSSGESISKPLWDALQEIGAKESNFNWDISMGYIRCGSSGLSVCKFRNGNWFEKHIPDWRNKTCKEANACLKEQDWQPF